MTVSRPWPTPQIWLAPTLFLTALILLAGHSRASAGAQPPPDFDPGPEPSFDDFCDLGLCFPVEHLLIDILPGNPNNCVVNDGHGVIRVAILGSATFDTNRIVVSSVRLASLKVNAAGNGNRLMSNFEDVNGDGFTDLVVQVDDVDGAFTPGWGWATLTAILTSGRPAAGSDQICVLG